MKLASLDPIERVVYVAERQAQGVVSLETFCPLEALDAKRPRKTLVSATEVAVVELLTPVIALEIFARTISKMVRRGDSAYLLGDKAVSAILVRCLDVSRVKVSMRLELLACVGLIFRFPVARKFGYGSSVLMQVRNNSWGQAALEYFGLAERSKCHVATQRLEEMIMRYERDYSELVKLCQSKARPLEARRIHALNRRVPFPVVT